MIDRVCLAQSLQAIKSGTITPSRLRELEHGCTCRAQTRYHACIQQQSAKKISRIDAMNACKGLRGRACVGKKAIYYEQRIRQVKVVAKARDIVRFGMPGGLRERFVSRSWDKLRNDRADAVVRATAAPKLQADALISTVKRMGIDPSKVDWDQLQGKDLSYDERLQKLEQVTGFSTKTAKEYELLSELWEERGMSNA